MTKLLVGLGNPGDEHSHDRHNAGFWFVDALARRLNSHLVSDKRYQGKVAKAKLDGTDLWLLEPSTYMNLSGLSVSTICRFHKIIPSDILVIHDELDLKPGTARIKFGGGTGGHNGLKDILSHLSTSDFWRLRIGIGHPRDITERKHSLDVADYVLNRPALLDQKLIEEAIENALTVLPQFLSGDIQNAIQELHSKTD